jgi:hypothetical protein
VAGLGMYYPQIRGSTILESDGKYLKNGVFLEGVNQKVIRVGFFIPGGVKLNSEQMTKAQKYCKWAGSALNYDDVPTAITNLQKALKLLQTGQDG